MVQCLIHTIVLIELILEYYVHVDIKSNRQVTRQWICIKRISEFKVMGGIVILISPLMFIHGRFWEGLKITRLVYSYFHDINDHFCHRRIRWQNLDHIFLFSSSAMLQISSHTWELSGLTTESGSELSVNRHLEGRRQLGTERRITPFPAFTARRLGEKTKSGAGSFTRLETTQPETNVCMSVCKYVCKYVTSFILRRRRNKTDTKNTTSPTCFQRGRAGIWKWWNANISSHIHPLTHKSTCIALLYHVYIEFTHFRAIMAKTEKAVNYLSRRHFDMQTGVTGNLNSAF